MYTNNIYFNPTLKLVLYGIIMFLTPSKKQILVYFTSELLCLLLIQLSIS